jgi:hypothetical protein
MKYAKAALALGTCILFASAGVALATGQPGSSAGVSCTVSLNALQTPGNAGSATNPSGTNGSPFNQAIAKEYAGNLGSPTTSNGHASPNAVSQYDVACKNVSSQVP